jgi:hypothetical protein
MNMHRVDSYNVWTVIPEYDGNRLRIVTAGLHFLTVLGGSKHACVRCLSLPSPWVTHGGATILAFRRRGSIDGLNIC